MKTMNFDDDQWKASEAIVNLFFSDLKVDWDDQDCVNALGALVHCMIVGQKNDNSILSNDVRRHVQSVVTRLEKQFQWIKVDLVASPLVWLRFAFQAIIHGIMPSARYLKCYGLWRHERAKAHGAEWVYPSAATAKVRGSKLNARLSVQKPVLYTIDRFLLYDRIQADPGGKTKWALKPAQVKSAAATLPSAIVKARKVRGQEKQVVSRDIRDVVGPKLYTLLGECVNQDAAGHAARTHIGKKNETGRYKSDLSRAELVALLQKNHKQLKKYSPNSISRALPDFVACPNYRRNKTVV